MSIYIQYELRLLFLSVLTGAGLMICYDLLRMFRILIPHGAWWVGAEDLCYWIYACLMTFTLLYRENDGNLRAYIIGCVFIGMAVYNHLFSRFFLNTLKKGVKYFRIKAKRQMRQKSKKKWRSGEQDGKIEKTKEGQME